MAELLEKSKTLRRLAWGLILMTPTTALIWKLADILMRGFCIQPLSRKIENCMNDKRFSFKWLGVFRMDAENISPREARRNFWHLVAGICLIITVWKIFTVNELLVK